MSEKLYRSKNNRILGGVCGGLAEYFDLDPSLVRILTLLLVFSGLSPVFYLIAWLIIPSEEELQ
ncbi:MAG: PspC domain-containing protein [Candidatus Nanohalobium sp.]